MKKNTSEESNQDIELRVSQFISLIDDLPYGTVLNHDSGIYFNKAVEKMIGYTNDEIKDIDEWFQALYKNEAEKVKAIYFENRGKNFDSEVIVDVITKSGQIKNIAFKDKLTPIGEIWGLEDKTEIIEVKAEKSRQEEEYDYLLDFVNIGFWEWNIETDNLIWNDNMYKIYGFGKDEKVNSYDDYKHKVHPDDMEKMSNDLLYVLDNPIEEFNNNFRIIQNNGSIKKIRAVAKVYRDSEGKAIKLVGLNWDITREKELEETKKNLSEKYELILNSIHIGVWDWDINSEIMTWSDTMYAVYGFEIDDKFSNMHYFQAVLHPDDAERVNSEIQNAIKTPGLEFESTFRIVVSDGNIKHIRAVSKSFRGDDGAANRMAGLNWDVTKEVEEEEQKKDLVDRYKFILNSIKMGLWDWDLKSDKLIWNDTLSEMLGYDLTNNVSNSESILNLLHPDDADKMRKELTDSINTPGQDFDSSFRIILEDGTLKHIRSVTKIYRDENGIAERMVGLNWDVTKEIKQEEVRKELAERYNFILNSINVGIWDWDTKSDKLIWDSTMYKVFGYDINNVVTTYDGFKEFLHPEDLERVDHETNISINTPGVEFESTFRVVQSNGVIRYIRSVSKTYRDEDGKAERMVGVSWDETNEVKRLEKEEEYNHLLDSMKIGFWEWSMETGALVWDKKMYEIYGFDINKKVSYSNYKDALHPDEAEIIEKELTNVIITPGLAFNRTFRIILNDGTLKHIRAVAKSYRGQDGIATKMVGLNWDVTEVIELEEERKELSEKYDLILENTKVGIWDWDLKNNKITRSKTIFKLFEVPENIDDSFDGIFSRLNKSIHPDDNEQLKSDIEKILSGEIDKFESEIRIITSTGNTKYLKSIVNNEKDKEGKLKRVYGVFLDNTKIKQYEMQLIEAVEKADSSNKSKSDFLANMSHEIRTPMNAIIGLTHLILNTELTIKQRDYLNKIKNSSRSLLGIINEILDFSKIEAGKIEIENIEFGLEQVLETVSNIVSYTAHEKGLEFIFSIGPDVPLYIVGDPVRLGQIITNICSNAVKFTDKGEIVVRIENVFEDAEQIELQVTISDTGIGMREEQLPNLFDLFFQADSSTTRNYGGTGLGLTICKSLVELLGGRIWVESEFGKGSKFYFTFKSQRSKTVGKSRDIPNIDLLGKRVLVCDDNESSRIALSEILTAFSFEVTTVDNGYTAIDEIRKASDKPFELVLMDWDMPGIDGIETTREIHKLILKNPPIVIMVTAYAKESVLEEASEMKLDAYLVKPVTHSILYDTIINLFQSKKQEYIFISKNKAKKENNQTLLKGKRILLAEDNEINQIVAEELLTNVGIIVDIANNGEEAVQKAKANKYDLVLMDLHMPVKDGYEATIEIREFISAEQLPIIAKTADAMENVKERCLQIGMNDFLTKPIEPVKLFDVLFKWLNKDSITDINDKPKSTSTFDFKKGIDGIDLEFGQKVVGGNEKLYIKLLTKFNQMYKNFFSDFSSACTSDIERARREIHTLKGVAGNIGAMKLYDLSDKYLDLLNNDFIPDQNNMINLKLELDKVLQSTSEYINTMDEINMLTNISSSFLEKKNELETLLRDNDFKSLTVINEIVESSEHLKYEKEFKLILKYITEYEFEKALLELNKLKL